MDELARKIALKGGVITVFDTDNLAKVIERMAKEQVTVVVVQKAEGDVLGLADCVDVMAYLSAVLGRKMEGDGVKDPSEELMAHAAGESMFAAAGNGLANFSATDPLVVLDATATVHEALEMFAKGVHRVLLRNEDHVIDSVLSQSDMMAHLRNLAGAMTNIGARTLADLGCVRDVVTCPADAPLLEAMALLRKHFLRAMPLVDRATGRFQTLFSATDVRYLLAEGFKSLPLPAIEIAYLGHQKRGIVSERYSVWLKPDSSVHEAVEICAKDHVHQVIIVDDSMKPIGVCSLTDLCKALLST